MKYVKRRDYSADKGKYNKEVGRRRKGREEKRGRVQVIKVRLFT